MGGHTFFSDPKKSNKDQQLSISNYFKSCAKIIEYYNKQRAHSSGYSKEDFEDAYYETLTIYFRSYDENKGSPEAYFKTVYNAKVTDGIRRQNNSTNSLFFHSLGYDCDHFDNDDYYTDFKVNNIMNSSDEIVTNVIENVCKDNYEDLVILQGIIDGTPINEISSILNLNRSTTFSKVRNLKAKIRKYLEKKQIKHY